jgi:two-component system, NtrC family, sensor histidine kinase PilS
MADYDMGRESYAWPRMLVLGIMLARLAVLAVLLLVLALLLPGDSVASYAFMALAYIVSIPFALWSRDRKQLTDLVPLQFLVDLVVVTGVVYFTGGIASDLSLLYPLIILSAGIVATLRHALGITALAVLAYGTLVVLMKQGVLVQYGPPVDHGDWAGILRTLGLRVLLFACFGAASAYLSQRCQFSDKKVRRYRDMVEIIFRNVRAGLMLLDRDGRILMVNDSACQLLAQGEKELLGLLPGDLVGSGHIHLGEGAGEGDPCSLKRPDGSLFPVSYETSKLTLPAELVPGKSGSGPMELHIMVFNDITRLMEMKEQVERIGRARVAVELAAEIAHDIRNPLAAVSGAVQVLQQTEKRAAAGDTEAIKSLPAERARSYAIIVGESERLDRTIERFISYTRFSPESLTEHLRSADERERAQSCQLTT